MRGCTVLRRDFFHSTSKVIHLPKLRVVLCAGTWPCFGFAVQRRPTRGLESVPIRAEPEELVYDRNPPSLHHEKCRWMAQEVAGTNLALYSNIIIYHRKTTPPKKYNTSRIIPFL